MFFDVQTKKCVTCTGGCLQCLSTTTCLGCQTGSSWNSTTSKCTPCVTGCLSCKGDQSCVDCGAGNYWDETPEKCLSCRLPGCKSCQSQYYCSECQPGFIPGSGYVDISFSAFVSYRPFQGVSGGASIDESYHQAYGCYAPVTPAVKGMPKLLVGILQLGVIIALFSSLC